VSLGMTIDPHVEISCDE